MPRVLPSVIPGLFSEEVAKPEQTRLLHLVEISDPAEILDTTYYVDSNYNVEYNNVEYTRFPLTFSGVSVSSDGSISKASVSIANVTRVLMPFIEQYDGLLGFYVKVTTVYEKFLDHIYTTSTDGNMTVAVNPNADSTAHLTEYYIIDSYTANEQLITFDLLPQVDFNVKVPRRRFTATTCYWRYKDPTTCGYSGGIATCDKSYAGTNGCKAHSNSARYGGFPGIPSDIRRVYL